MVFTGYTLEEAQAMNDPDITELLAHTDVLVDGPYLREYSRTPSGAGRLRNAAGLFLYGPLPAARRPVLCQKNTLGNSLGR